jgi:hypothetical protein
MKRHSPVAAGVRACLQSVDCALARNPWRDERATYTSAKKR